MKIMIYKLIGLLILSLTWNSAWSQSISGPTEICPASFMTTTYELIDIPCDEIEDVDWQLDYPVPILYSGTNPVVLTWSTTGSDNDATLTVTYKCINYDEDGEPIVTLDTVELEITILNINEPIITSSNLVELTCSDTEFTIDIASQPGGAVFDITYPDCFEYTYDNLQFDFTTDNAATGEICITVYQLECGTSKTECVTVTRACEDNLIFSSSSPITDSYNSVNNYITASDVSTTAFSELEFKAGKAILLQPGFYANEVFLAHIGPCSCVPEGEIGCFYSRAPAGSNSTNGNQRNFRFNSDNTTEHKEEVISTIEVNTLNIYPNPSSGTFNIHFDELPLNTNIQIFDLMGRLRKSIPINNTIQTIDASELENGVYMIVVPSEEQLFKEKIIISK